MPNLKPLALTAALSSLAMLQGCMVLAVVDTVGSIAVKTVGLAADTAVGAVKLTGKAVGVAGDALLGSDDK